jgi:signal transduction histidine kinase
LVLPRGISLWGSPATAFGLLAVALIVIGSVAWLIARAFSRPIAELQLAVRELATGDTDARVPAAIAERGDELGALAADFNIMARRLEELIATREQLMRDMSHELRSPLARLQAAIALAAERNSLAPETRDRIDQEIGRMNQVIGEMLRYSSLEASANNRLRLIRVDKLLKQLVDVEEIEARNAGCVIELETDKDIVVAGDPEMLQSCFENILRNAIRHSPADSVIEINARSIDKNKNTNRSSGSVLIKISDRGPGVPKEQVDKIFLPYVRINDGNNDVNRTGLGLAIVRRIVEKHAGNVRAANREEGGLIVTVELPAAELL